MYLCQATFGFLFLEYGETAWWWEVEELVRKLLLSALVVLIDAGSPLQVLYESRLVALPKPSHSHLSNVTTRHPPPHPSLSTRAPTTLHTTPPHSPPRALNFNDAASLSRASAWRFFVNCLVLQIALAVLVSGWAHVLHAVYKPWGKGADMYRLQHLSLFVTSFVFLMGLLFKVRRHPPCCCARSSH